MKSRQIMAAAAIAVAAGGTGIATWLLATRGPIGNPAVPEPARAVELARYLGRWYELGRYENRFERGMDGVTADYRLLEDGRIGVTNAGRLAGRQRTAEGRARVVPDSGGAKLKVSFFGPFYVGDYWVLDHDDAYRWSIVGEPSGRFLWILCRDAQPDEALRATLLRRVAALGYDRGLIRPTRQPQR